VQVDSELKNYGVTTAQHITVRQTMHIDEWNAKVKIDVDSPDSGGAKSGDWSRVDRSPVPVDLPPTAVLVLKSDRPPHLRMSATQLSEIASGRRKLLLFTEVRYKDLLGISHTKAFCHKYLNQLAPAEALSRCQEADFVR
jgi:hypothetical protein